ncbi:MAG: AAA family ATPase [Deltaproteobacteria bacterium]|nr:AAA family ATPase [Deltaproteobacteria bacterium]
MQGRIGASGGRAWIFALAAALFVALGMGVGAAVFHLQSLPPEIPYFEFRLLVAADLVTEAQVGDDEVRGTVPTEPSTALLERYAQAAAAFWPEGGAGTGPRQVPFPAVGDDGSFRAFRPTGEPTTALLEQLDTHHVRHAALPASPWPRVAAFALAGAGLLALLALVPAVWRVRGGPRRGGEDARDEEFRLPEPELPETKFHDVGGLDDAMDTVLELVDLLKMPDRLRRLGATLPRGVLLVGPRGIGKTLLARALAGEALVPLLRVQAPELAGGFAAEAARRVRALFERAEQLAPCVVVVEDLEGLTRRTGRQGDAPGFESGGTLQALLAELERFDPRSGVVLLAATSRPDVIDPTLLRPGRFDRILALGRPDRFGREAILRVHAQRVRLGKDVSLADVAARTPGLVGADLAALVNEAALIAARREHTTVLREDVESALSRVVDVALRAIRIFSPEERALLAAHEAGRAVAAAALPEHPDGATGGATLVPRDPLTESALVRRPIEERRVLDEPALKARLVELVAGRAAELLLLGTPTTTSRPAMAEARTLAAMMAVELGIRAGADAPGRPEAPGEPPDALRLLAEAEHRAHALLADHRPALEEVARRLAERERVAPGDLLRIVHGRLSGEAAPPEATEA